VGLEPGNQGEVSNTRHQVRGECQRRGFRGDSVRERSRKIGCERRAIQGGVCNALSFLIDIMEKAQISMYQ
jgi:hypothetical protein